LRFRAGPEVANHALGENAPKRCPTAHRRLSQDEVLHAANTADDRAEVRGQDKRAPAPPYFIQSLICFSMTSQLTRSGLLVLMSLVIVIVLSSTVYTVLMV
jgi:hypothetical protein